MVCKACEEDPYQALKNGVRRSKMFEIKEVSDLDMVCGGTSRATASDAGHT